MRLYAPVGQLVLLEPQKSPLIKITAISLGELPLIKAVSGSRNLAVEDSTLKNPPASSTDAPSGGRAQLFCAHKGPANSIDDAVNTAPAFTAVFERKVACPVVRALQPDNTPPRHRAGLCCSQNAPGIGREKP